MCTSENELIVIPKVGINEVDSHPELLRYLYDGHETGLVRDGSIVIADSSKKEPIEGELYVYKKLWGNKRAYKDSFILRRFMIPEKAGTGIDLVSIDGSKKTNIKDLETVYRMTVGRVIYLFARLLLARDTMYSRKK